VEKKDLCGKVESVAAERERLVKIFFDLEAQLKESESRLEESELQAAKEREASK